MLSMKRLLVASLLVAGLMLMASCHPNVTLVRKPLSQRVLEALPFAHAAPSQPVYIVFELTVDGLADVIEHDSIVRWRIKFRADWMLQGYWPESLTRANISSGEFTFYPAVTHLWVPRIICFNCVDERFNHDLMENSVGSITYGGSGRPSAAFMIRASIGTACTIEPVRFPNDHQICDIKFAVVSQSFARPVLANIGCSEHFTINDKWAIVGVNWTFEGVENVTTKTGGIVSYRYLLRRQSFYSVAHTLLPILILAVGGVAVFVLPARSGTKTNVAFTVLLTYFFFLSYLIYRMPAVSSPMPQIVKFVVSLFVVAALVSFVSAVLDRLEKVPKVFRIVNNVSLLLYMAFLVAVIAAFIGSTWPAWKTPLDEESGSFVMSGFNSEFWAENQIIWTIYDNQNVARCIADRERHDTQRWMHYFSDYINKD